MAMHVESLSNSPNPSLRVKGDLGDLQISPCDEEDDKICEKQKNSRAVSALPSIPAGLVKPSVVPVFGSVAVTNSENVHFGNNTYFNGPVTIKQVIQAKSGVDNASYKETENDSEVGGNSGTFRVKQPDAPIQRLQILVWHKVTLSAICITFMGGIIAMILVVLKFENRSAPSLPDTGLPSTTDSSANTMVMVYCTQSFQVLMITMVLLPLTLLFMFTLLTRDKIGRSSTTVQKSTDHENSILKSCMTWKGDPLFIAPGHLRIVSRTDWLAQPPQGALDKLILPAPWVIISHTAAESCFTQGQCILRVRLVQQFHIESRGWYDIGYNFLVGGDGSVYKGRGWDYEGAHTKYYNKYSIGIAFIGTFNTDSPTLQQVKACEKLLKLGVTLGKIAKDYKLFAHRQLMSTVSPGDKVYNIIKEWPHFVTNYSDVENLLPPGREA